MNKITQIGLFCTVFLMGCNETPVYKVQLSEETESHCANISPYGLPVTNNQTNGFYCLEGFALEYNRPIASAMWVSERISHEHLKENLKEPIREDEYRPLPFLVKNMQMSLDRLQSEENYRGMKFAATKNYRAKTDDFAHQKMMSQTYFIPNVALIHTGAKNLVDNVERHIRAWALMKKTDLVVHTGPLFLYNKGDTIPSIKSGQIEYKIPTHYYKIVLSPRTKESISIVIPNRDLKDDTNFTPYIVPMEFITTKNFINFLPKLTDENLKRQYMKAKNNGEWKTYSYKMLVDKDY